MMLNYDMTKLPGQWRTGSINVVHEPTGNIVCEGPELKIVPSLIDGLVTQINRDDQSDSVVSAAMAHLNLAKKTH